MIIIMGGAARAAAAAAVACLAAGCSGGPGPSPQASAGAATTSASPSTPAPAPTFAATPPSEERAVLGAWLDEVGNPDTSAITAAVRPVVTDIQRLDFADLPARCTGLAQVVVTLQQHRPVPDAAAETQWSKALADLHLAATTCVPAAGRQDVTGLHRTGNAMMAAVGEFTAFATRISQLSS